eukprot:TRINITY_DN6735_c0_g1_i2.p1 TRINITY_DN6735_c0_g1~~TRINITY_DN6735_c0_g1_i2.p1  ORF type:complete len:287 (+),score=34.26 TRINITY_DN6735_c0_g1_i2:32-892(+)
MINSDPKSESSDKRSAPGRLDTNRPLAHLPFQIDAASIVQAESASPLSSEFPPLIDDPITDEVAAKSPEQIRIVGLENQLSDLDAQIGESERQLLEFEPKLSDLVDENGKLKEEVLTSEKVRDEWLRRLHILEARIERGATPGDVLIAPIDRPYDILVGKFAPKVVEKPNLIDVERKVDQPCVCTLHVPKQVIFDRPVYVPRFVPKIIDIPVPVPKPLYIPIETPFLVQQPVPIFVDHPVPVTKQIIIDKPPIFVKATSIGRPHQEVFSPVNVLMGSPAVGIFASM